MVSVQSRFNYAWGLIKSNKEDDQRLGIKILGDIFKDSPIRRRECLYYLALGSYKLGEYATARRYADSLANHDPTNPQASALKEMIEDKIAKGMYSMVDEWFLRVTNMHKEGIIGIAIVSGVVAAGATALSLLLRRKR